MINTYEESKHKLNISEFNKCKYQTSDISQGIFFCTGINILLHFQLRNINYVWLLLKVTGWPQDCRGLAYSCYISLGFNHSGIVIFSKNIIDISSLEEW